MKLLKDRVYNKRYGQTYQTYTVLDMYDGQVCSAYSEFRDSVSVMWSLEDDTGIFGYTFSTFPKEAFDSMMNSEIQIYHFLMYCHQGMFIVWSKDLTFDFTSKETFKIIRKNNECLVLSEKQKTLLKEFYPKKGTKEDPLFLNYNEKNI